VEEQLRLGIGDLVEDKDAAINGAATEDFPCNDHGLQRRLTQQVPATHAVRYTDVGWC
jgi:hypothetical protein